jgi:hypothetical protein
MLTQKNLLLCASLLAVALFFAFGSPDKELLDTWKMVKVVEKENDITSKLNPNNDRWITFKDEKHFESGGTPYRMNTGTYTLDQKSLTLSLFSDAGEGDNSQWQIRIHRIL